MFEWLVVILLIVFGIALIIAELIFVPGTTVVGILGLGLSGAGIYFGFNYFGPEVGWLVVLITGVVTISALVYSLRSGAWKRFALNKSIDSHVNEEYKYEIKVGDVGRTVSALRPIGKAEFDDQLLEVRTNGEYIKSGNLVKIIQIKGNRIFVELNNTI